MLCGFAGVAVHISGDSLVAIIRKALIFIYAEQSLINGNYLNTGVGMRHNLNTNLQLSEYYLEATNTFW
jgi:hypothetical protein